jgi:FixJ family two-component response regulator
VVYLVEDDEAVRESQEILLESRGFRVEPFGAGAALLAAGIAAPNACVLIDIRLPDMTGYELADELRRRHPDLPILLTSGRADSEAQAKASAVGARLLGKPVSLATLLAAIAEALEDQEGN